MKALFALLSLIVVLPLLLTACSAGSYGEGYNVGFEEGYNKGWQEGYEKGSEEAPVSPKTQIPTSPTKPITTLGEITIADAEYVLNLLPLLPAAFDKVDAASEGMSNADLGLGDDFSEVQVFISDEPFQMIYGVLAIIDSRIERSSVDAIMNDETMISNLIKENVKAGALEEGFEMGEIELNITYPTLGDSAFLGEGYMTIVGLSAGFDALWFRSNKVYVMVYSVYYTLERQRLLPIGEELERRISQYSQ